MSRKRVMALLGAPSLAFVACQFEPGHPELVYTPNEAEIAKNDYLVSDLGAQDQLMGALEFLVGTPQHPKYLALPEWLENGFDPNYWGFDTLTDDERDELARRNRAAYASQIAAIEAGDFDEVSEPLYAPDLWVSWQGLLAELGEDGDPDAEYDDYGDGPVTWRQEAIYRWENYYPSLAASADMYRTQCFHCHGASGGGDGSTADFLNPRPRDYRRGIFKFTALDDKSRPRHGDLMRILKEGIYTTAMPSFRRFTDAQLSGLADYVRLLAVRGETEVIMAADYDRDEGLHFENVRENYELVVDRWREADDFLITYDGDVPESTPESVARGRDLFMRADAGNCVKCHGTTGRGDGESVKNNPEDATDEWGRPILPRDLTRGVFRFGRRPIDLYRRIYAGINGTPMPKHFDMQITGGEGETRNMNEDDIWDLVAFVRSLSDEEPHAEPAEPEAPGEEEGH